MRHMILSRIGTMQNYGGVKSPCEFVIHHVEICSDWPKSHESKVMQSAVAMLATTRGIFSIEIKIID